MRDLMWELYIKNVWCKNFSNLAQFDINEKLKKVGIKNGQLNINASTYFRTRKSPQSGKITKSKLLIFKLVNSIVIVVSKYQDFQSFWIENVY